MSYVVEGLPPERFAELHSLSDEDLVEQGMRRVVADADRGFPCRVSLVDARKGEHLLLTNFASNDSDGPYRSAFAIYVREEAERSRYVDTLPPVFQGRPLSFRGYDGAGDLVAARLSAQDSDHDEVIRAMLEDPAVHHIDAHNAAHGCFAARIERDRSEA